MELKDIKELIALIRKNDLSEFSLEQEGFKITLKRGYESQPLTSGVSYGPQLLGSGHLQLPSQGQASSMQAPQASLPASQSEPLRDLPSPMVGTFYASPSPEAPPFASVGQQITPDTVICIIEAMKVMNEIKSEVSGTIVEIVAENGKPVHYGQPLFRLR